VRELEEIVEKNRMLREITVSPISEENNKSEGEDFKTTTFIATAHEEEELREKLRIQEEAFLNREQGLIKEKEKIHCRRIFVSEFERPDNYSRLDTVATLQRRINEGSRHTASIVYNSPEAAMAMVPEVRPVESSDLLSIFWTIF